VKVRKLQTPGRELVQIGRGNLAAVATKVGKTHVIHEDDNDVGLVCGGRVQGQQAKQGKVMNSFHEGTGGRNGNHYSPY
jgi:hypothetical protein